MIWICFSKEETKGKEGAMFGPKKVRKGNLIVRKGIGRVEG